MPSILFLCTANRFRSPLAARYFLREVMRHRDDDVIQVSSAGTWTAPGQPPVSKAVKLGKIYDLDLNDHKSTMISEEILEQADLILVMENGHKEAITHEFPDSAERVLLLTEAVEELTVDIPDPYNSKRANAEDIAREIFSLIDEGYEKIVALSWIMMGKRAT